MAENIIKYGQYDLDKGLLLRNIQSEAIKSSFTNHYGLEGEQLKAFNTALGDVIDGLVNGTLDPQYGLGNFEGTSDKIQDNDIYSKALEYVHKVANAVGTNQPKQNINRRSYVQEGVEQPVQPIQKEEGKEDVVTPELTPYTNNAHSFSAYFKQQTNPFGSYQLGSPEEEAHINEWAKQFNGDKLKMAQGLAKMIEDYGKQFDYTKVNLGNISQEDHQSGINNAVNALNDGYKPEEINALTYLNAGNYAKLFTDDQTPTPPTPPQDINSEGFWDSLSDDDKIRIGTAGADVASALAAWIPGYGTAASAGLGIGSTLTNAYLDFKDDKTSFWQDIGNLGFGLGMDIFGLIPGFGTGAKGAKVMKIVKPISGALFAGFGYLGLTQAQDVLKRMDDPNYELTTDDIRALSAGISTLVGGSTYLANKRQLGKVTTARDMAEVQTKSGKPAKITQEELAEIQKLEGFEAQNAKFKNITGEELAAELKGRNLNPFSDDFQLTKNGPNVSTYKERNFVDEVPRKYRMLQWMNGETPKIKKSKSGPESEDLQKLHEVDKKEYKKAIKNANKEFEAEDKRIKQLQEISNRGKTDLTQEQINIINADRARKGLNPLSEKEISKINNRRNSSKRETETLDLTDRKPNRLLDIHNKNKAIQKEKEEIIANHKEELRQASLAKPQGGTPVEAAPKGSGRTVAQIKKLAESIPTVKPKPEAKPVTANVPALIPKPIFKNIREIAGNNGSPLKTMQGLNQALAQKMHSQGLEAKMNRMIEPHAEEVLGRKRKEYLSGLVKNVQNLQVPELPRKPLIGAARTAKEKIYDQLFNERYYAMQEALRANKTLPHKNKEKAPKKKKQKDRYINRRALGGILFAQGGDTINKVNGTPIQPGSTWYSAIGKHFREELAKGLRAGTYKNTDINSMQEQHQLIDSWGAGMVGNPTENQIVKQYYENINNNYGFVNNLGIKAGEDASRYKVINGNSGDTFSKGWKADGYYSGRGQDRKLLGTINDYTKEELAETLDFWKKEGYDMKANDNGYYELHPVNTNSNDSEKDDVNSEDPIKNNRKGKIFSIWGKGNGNNETGEPLQPFKSEVKRDSIEADDIATIINYFKTRNLNNELYDLSTQVPTLYFKPKQRTYYHRGDFNALMQGNQEEANVVNSMSAMDTSDYMHWLSKRAQGIMLGKKAKLPYYEMDRQARRESENFAWKVNSEVADYNLANADKNATNAHQTQVEELGSKALQLRANLDSEVNLYNALATKQYKRGLEEYLKNKENEETDKAIYTTLLNMDINKNPNNYIQKWTNSHSDLWKRYQAGEQIQDPNEINKLLDIRNQMQLAQLSRLYPNSRYLQDLPGITPVKAGSWQFPKLAITNKKGGKITKDMVDTIISYLKESNKNYHKDADRSVRGLYNFIKGQRKK